MRKKWLYKVENDKISVLLSLIVTVIFAAVTAVLHGFIITLVFTIVMAALTLCSAYRFIFIKLLIGEDSFCHCKSPWDKKEYKYTDISEVWESTGKSVNGASQNYLITELRAAKWKNFIFRRVNMMKFLFLLRKLTRIILIRKRPTVAKMSNKQKYVIDGKLYGKFPMLFSSAVSLVFLILAVDQLRGGSGKIFTVGLMFSVGFALSLFVSIPLINRYFFFKVCVGENDFSLRTTPFNEKTYKYS